MPSIAVTIAMFPYALFHCVRTVPSVAAITGVPYDTGKWMPVCTDIQLTPAWPESGAEALLRDREHEFRPQPLLAGRFRRRLLLLGGLLRLEVDTFLRPAGPVGEVVRAAERLWSCVSSLLLTADGFTAVPSDALRVVLSLLSFPPMVPTEAAATPATPITQAEGTATVSKAERFAGLRRRERDRTGSRGGEPE